jgi:hypothetical protein
MSEQYCGNCAHLDALHPVAEVEGIPVCRCLSKYSSLEPEVGSRINLVLVSAYCNCSQHGDAFEPAGEYTAWLDDVTAQNNTLNSSDSTIPACYL